MSSTSLYDKIVKVVYNPIIDWDIILSVCEEINSTKDPKVKGIICETIVSNLLNLLKIKRKYTLHYNVLCVIDVLAKNCGEYFHRSIATKSFMDEIKTLILKRWNKNHGSGGKAQLKTMIGRKSAEMLMLWAVSFKSNPRFSIFEITYSSLLSKGVVFPPTSELVLIEQEPPKSKDALRSSVKSNTVSKRIPDEAEAVILEIMDFAKTIEEFLGSPETREFVKDLVENVKPKHELLQSLVEKYIHDETCLMRLLNANDRIEEVLERAKGIALPPSNPIPQQHNVHRNQRPQSFHYQPQTYNMPQHQYQPQQYTQNQQYQQQTYTHQQQQPQQTYTYQQQPQTTYSYQQQQQQPQTYTYPQQQQTYNYQQQQQPQTYTYPQQQQQTYNYQQQQTQLFNSHPIPLNQNQSQPQLQQYQQNMIKQSQSSPQIFSQQQKAQNVQYSVSQNNGPYTTSTYNQSTYNQSSNNQYQYTQQNNPNQYQSYTQQQSSNQTYNYPQSVNYSSSKAYQLYSQYSQYPQQQTVNNNTSNNTPNYIYYPSNVKK